MKVTRFTDPQAFNEHIGVALAPRERENNLLLGIVRHLVEKRDDTAYMVAIAAETETVCVAVMTPPFNLVLSTGPTQAVEPLIDHLEAADVPVLGVISIATMADAFTSAWQRQAGSKIDLGTDMRLYALGTAPRVPPVPGGLEAAAIADVPLLVEWSNAFFAEANMTEAERDFFIARLEEMIACVAVDPGRATGLHGRPFRDDADHGPHRAGLHAGAVAGPRLRDGRSGRTQPPPPRRRADLVPAVRRRRQSDLDRNLPPPGL